MLEMEPEEKTTMDDKVNVETKTVTTRLHTSRVRFAPFVSKITLPAGDYDEEDNNNNSSGQSKWYSKAEMHRLARADVDALIAQDRAGAASSNVANNNAEGVVCRRGLEMYMPGELSFRQRRRKAFSCALIQKQALLKTLYGENRNDVAERLRDFLEIRSKKCREEAQALGMQDALDALVQKKDSVKPTEHLPSKDTSVTTKKVLTTMRNTTIIRAV